MNAFADWLFSVLLGWTGTAANSAWNAIVNNQGGIGGFFSRFWLPIVLLLVVGGTLLDYAVWFARWKPYLVWRSWLTRRRRERVMAHDAQQLERGQMDPGTQNTIADWVTTPQDHYPVYDLPYTGEQEAAPYWDAQPDQWVAPQQTEKWAYMPPQLEEVPLPLPPEHGQPEPYLPPAPVTPDMMPEPDPMPAPRPFYFPPIEEQSPESWFPQQHAAPYQEPPVDSPLPQAPVRKRRTERARQNRAATLLTNLRDRLGTAEDQESMIDGLPSPIREEDAFHEAVYPSNYRYQQPDANGHYNNQNGNGQP